MSLLPLDLAEELKLRRWARLNYVVPAERDWSMHPIILQEMDRVDDECAGGDLTPESLTAIQEPHSDHLSPQAPNFLTHSRTNALTEYSRITEGR